MFASAIVCTDGSFESDQLLGIVPRLRQFGVTSVTLVRPVGSSEAGMHGQIAERLLEQETSLSGRGFEVHAVMRQGDAGAVVEQVANETGAGMVFLGVSGLGRSSRVLVGGTEAPGAPLAHPMLTLRVSSVRAASARSASLIPMLSKVLVATDFTDASDGAIDTALNMVRQGATEVVLLHVCPGQPMTEDRIRLRTLGDRLRSAGCLRVSEELVDGETPAEAITHRAHVGDITLVVLGSRGHGLFDGVMTGSVGAEVARYIETPLLVVPPVRDGGAASVLQSA